MNNNCGVYRIVNTENGKRYYGSSKTLRERWIRHKSLMRRGEHSNPGIREDAANYGEEAFEFEVLCYCAPEERKRLEGVLIDQSLGEECYNRQDGSDRHTEESKALVSAAMKGRKFSEEHKAKLSAAKKGKPKRKVTCPHCGLIGGVSNMKRWHFENCKHKTPAE